MTSEVTCYVHKFFSAFLFVVNFSFFILLAQGLINDTNNATKYYQCKKVEDETVLQ